MNFGITTLDIVVGEKGLGRAMSSGLDRLRDSILEIIKDSVN